MFSMLRFFMTAIGLVLIAAGVGAVVLSTQVEKYGRGWAEDRLEHLFDTRVELESLELAPLQRGMALRGLTIFNPEGFDAGPALKVGRAVISLDPRTLFSAAPAMDLLRIDGLELWSEGLGKNLQRIAERAASLMRGPNAPVPVRIRKLVCSGGTLHAGPAPVKLRPFEIEALGPEQPLPEGEFTMLFLKNVGLDLVTIKGLVPGLLEAM